MNILFFCLAIVFAILTVVFFFSTYKSYEEYGGYFLYPIITMLCLVLTFINGLAAILI